MESRAPGTARITTTTDNGKTCFCNVTVPIPQYQLFIWLKDGEKTGYLFTDKPQLRLENSVIKFTTDNLSLDIPTHKLDKFTLERIYPEYPRGISTVSNVTVGLRKTRQLTYTLFPIDAQTQVTWLNSNPDVVSVTSDGLVTGLQQGVALLKVQTSNGLRAACQVTVPKTIFRFKVWLRDGSVDNYAAAEKPEVTLGTKIFTLTTTTTTIGYAAKDLLKFTFDDESMDGNNADLDKDGKITVADITLLINLYLKK